MYETLQQQGLQQGLGVRQPWKVAMEDTGPNMHVDSRIPSFRAFDARKEALFWSELKQHKASQGPNQPLPEGRELRIQAGSRCTGCSSVSQTPAQGPKAYIDNHSARQTWNTSEVRSYRAELLARSSKPKALSRNSLHGWLNSPVTDPQITESVS